MSHAAPIRALILAAGLVIVSAAPAHAGTIVFDFEDGLQGWEPFGPVQRVQTQLLGGEWAIFGDGFVIGEASMIFQEGNTGISLASVERTTLDALVVVPTDRPFPEPVVILPLPDRGFLPFATARWSVAVSELGRFQGFLAFIDNITFHTIPEPSVLGMLVMGGVALTVRRRTGGGRHV